MNFDAIPIGTVRSALADVVDAPRQNDEGAPDAWLVFHAEMADGLRDVQPGDEMVLLTWLHLASRDVLRVHPRDDTSRPPLGVFSTRSPDRPNPIGLHRVRVTAVDGCRVRVAALEAVDGTPILDLKPVLAEDAGLR